MTIFTTIRLFLFSVLIVLYNNSFSQYKFQKTYKGLTISNGHQTPDGGYIATGTTKAYGAGSDDYFLLKVNPMGITEWLKTYGDNNKDQAYEVHSTFDGGYIIVGFTYGFVLGGAKFYVIKTKSNGDTLWTKIYGAYSDHGWSIQQTPDSGFILCGIISIGSLNEDISLIKIDVNGNLIWSKSIGGPKKDLANCIRATKDNNYIVVGATLSFGPEPDENIYLIKINNSGDTLWCKAYSCYIEEWGQSIIQTDDGGFIIVSTIWDFGAGAFDIFILKTDENGNVLWGKTYGTNLDEFSSSISQTRDGGYILTGKTRSFTGPSGQGQEDIYVLRLNAVGDTLWTRTFGRNTESDFGAAIQETADSGFVIFAASSNLNGTGNFFSYIIKTDKNGETACNSSYNSTIITNAPTMAYSAIGVIGSNGSEKSVPTIVKDTLIQDSALCFKCGEVRVDFDSIMCKGDRNQITATSAVNSSFSWTPAEKLSCSDCPDPSAIPDTSLFYYLTVTDIYGCESNDSIFITVDSCSGDIFIPDIFSPDNDGVNDYFAISGIGKTGWSLHIFNRWGELMYTTDLPSEKYWSGRTFSGADVTIGVYYYILKNETLNLIYKGHLQLIR